MDIGTILKKVGTSIVKNTVPGGSLIIDLINTYLDDDQKLSEDSTGKDIIQKVKTLPLTDQKEIFDKQLDVELANIASWENVTTKLAELDERDESASTRPTNARRHSNLLIFCVASMFIMLITLCTASYFSSAAEMKAIDNVMQTLNNMWPVIATLLTPSVMIVMRYQGIRKTENLARYNVINGMPAQTPTSGIMGAVQNTFGLPRK